jgi:hypothetical protein
MEFLDGQLLKDCIASRPLSLVQVWDLGAEITDGVDAPHHPGLVTATLRLRIFSLRSVATQKSWISAWAN